MGLDKPTWAGLFWLAHQSPGPSTTDWKAPAEARQAVKLIPKWAEIDVDTALELQGPTFDNKVVRGYAVDRLRKADNAELLLYLLQLTQAQRCY
jgi:phosphatidylinositol 3-kinase